MAQIKLHIDYNNNVWTTNFVHQFVVQINSVNYIDYIYAVKNTPASYADVQKGATLTETVSNIKARIDAVTTSLGLTAKVLCEQVGTNLTITIGEEGDTVDACFFYTDTHTGDETLYPSCYIGGTWLQAELSIEVVTEPGEILPTENITTISTPEQITFCNSPININLEQAGILSATVYLFIWNGDLEQSLGVPTVTLFKEKVSANDNYIHLEISDYLRSFLVAPPNALNTSQPNFVYNELSNPTITGQGCFWQIVADVTTATETTRYNYESNFCTLGYKWNYEQTLFNPINIESGGSLGFLENYTKYYNSKIHNYISQNFDLTKPIDEATSANIILVNNVTIPAGFTKCSQQPYLIVYLNKVGLFEMFTPYGKVAVSGKIESETSNRSYRNPAYVDNSFMHSEIRTISESIQQYTINTGLLRPDMVAQVEEIIHSPKVYLIEFKGDLNLVSTVGVTIDNTYITIDDLNTTIDGLSVTENYVEFFKTHRQIPVTVVNSDFERKVRLNNKNAIDFNIQFKETNSKINNIR